MRFARILWLVLFLIPLGAFAGRFCYIHFADPAYHWLISLHERLPFILLVLAAFSAAAALVRFVRIQARLGALLALRSTAPPIVREVFEQQGRSVGVRLDVVYIDVPAIFCFTSLARRVIISRGFVGLLDDGELALAANHEAQHVRRGDPWKALVWHLVFAALILPGFERVEDSLYEARERYVDRLAQRLDPAGYQSLLHRFKNSMCNRAPEAAFRSLVAPNGAPSIRALAYAWIPLGLLLLLAMSHVAFVQNLPYLQSHHC